ncbi:MAG TPA: hypothetical protein VGN72_05460 [Tepidisphaeraceae bacterium]|jgi:hypothetical protein|nr:hypothetical protein [Tepidisphaeraceae bacterium]
MLPEGSQFSIVVLLTLVVIALTSLGVFFVLVHRWTHGKRRYALREWARRHDFHAVEGTFPAIVNPVIATAPQGSEQFSNGRSTVLRLYTDNAAWHVLVRRMETPWPTTGVRPVANTTSVLDLYSLASFPSLTTGERFIVYGTDSAAARSLASSSLRALLPPDIGVLLAGQDMMVDFTARPFDEIEFDRMIALADQLVAHLPAVVKK